MGTAFSADELPALLFEPVDDPSALEAATGAFHPILLNVVLDQPVPDRDHPDYLKRKCVEFHEFVHYFQAVGSIYCVHTLQDALECIRHFLRHAGGDPDLVFPGGSDILQGRTPPAEHLAQHTRCFDGNYASRPIELPTRDRTAVTVRLNPETGCWEYIRWNHHAKTFFSTPLGATSFMECAAYLNQYILLGGGSDILVTTQFPSGPTSRHHLYTAPLELYLSLFPDKQTTHVLATLLAVLDLSLQFPNTLHRGHPQWPAMTHPGTRFVFYTNTLKGVRFLDPLLPGDYKRFVTEIETALGWPSTFQIWAEYRDYFRAIVDDMAKVAHEAVNSDREAFEDFIRRRTRTILSGNLRAGNLPGGKSAMIATLREVADQIRAHPTTYLGILGCAVFEEFAKAMDVRVATPHHLALPYAYPLELLEKIGPPTVVIADRQRNDWSKFALMEDMTGISHLWSLTRRWLAGQRADFVCGKRDRRASQTTDHFPCADRQFVRACPTWPTGGTQGTRCTFTDVLAHFGLAPGVANRS